MEMSTAKNLHLFHPPSNLFIILIWSGFCFMLNSFILLLLCEREKKATFWISLSLSLSLSYASLTNGKKVEKTNRSLSKQNNLFTIYYKQLLMQKEFFFFVWLNHLKAVSSYKQKVCIFKFLRIQWKNLFNKIIFQLFIFCLTFWISGF